MAHLPSAVVCELQDAVWLNLGVSGKGQVGVVGGQVLEARVEETVVG